MIGAGLKHAVQLLVKNNPSLSRKEAEKKVAELYRKTKGRRFGTMTFSSKSGIPQFWYGGSETFMFNAMESIAKSDDPRTPVLHCGIPDSLLPKYVGNGVCNIL
jgi:DNA polymerase gamma 1